jgi:hypothetical protein
MPRGFFSYLIEGMAVFEKVYDQASERLSAASGPK